MKVTPFCYTWSSHGTATIYKSTAVHFLWISHTCSPGLLPQAAMASISWSLTVLYDGKLGAVPVLPSWLEAQVLSDSLTRRFYSFLALSSPSNNRSESGWLLSQRRKANLPSSKEACLLGSGGVHCGEDSHCGNQHWKAAHGTTLGEGFEGASKVHRKNGITG